MPCPPGSRPVTNVDHATGLCGGFDVPSGWKLPSRASVWKCGMRPSSIKCCRITGSMPSIPSTNTPGSVVPLARARHASATKARENEGRMSLLAAGFADVRKREDARTRRRTALHERRRIEHALHRAGGAALRKDHLALHVRRNLLPEEPHH